MGVDVTDAITPSPSPAGTAVRKLRNSPARAATQAYSATIICTTTNGQNVGLRSVFTADVTTPVAIPTPGPGRVRHGRGDGRGSERARRGRDWELSRVQPGDKVGARGADPSRPDDPRPARHRLRRARRVHRATPPRGKGRCRRARGAALGG